MAKPKNHNSWNSDKIETISIDIAWSNELIDLFDGAGIPL